MQHRFRLHLSLFIILFPFAASSPLHHPSGVSKTRRHSTAEPPHEYTEVNRRLPFDSLTPSCTLETTALLHPANTTYVPPRNCTWSNAVLHFSATSSGSSHARVAAVWLSGAELLRTSTPETTSEGISWNFQKDVTRYASILRHSNITLVVMLENAVNDVVDNGILYQFNLTFLYYDVSRSNHGVNTPFPPNQNSKTTKLRESSELRSFKKTLELDENPADLILPISSTGEKGFWFKIEGEKDEINQQIQIPLNTYRAVIEIYVSFHENDELWYLNPPNYYFVMNGLPTKRGHGAYREVIVKIDDNIVGSAIPFPVIFTGGINPLFWKPVVSIGAFDFPSYEIELTPFLGMLLDGKAHNFEFRIADAISYWMMDANLHLWLDDKSDKVEAGPIRYRDPSNCVEHEAKFHQLNGRFDVEGERKSEFSGWVKCSAGNFTCHVRSRLEFENRITFKNNGMYKVVRHEVKVMNKVEMKSELGFLITNMTVERRYPLRLKMKTVPRSDKDGYMISVELDHSLKEEKKKNKRYERELENRQSSSGWLLVVDDVISGEATTFQSYYVEDNDGCYVRKVVVNNGAIDDDTENFLCAVAVS